MPFISVKLDAKESKVAPEGRYPLRVNKVEEKKTGAAAKFPGEKYFGIMILNESTEGNYMPVFWNLMLPDATKHDEQTVRLRKLEIQRFLAQFNVPGDANGFDTDDLIGANAEGTLVVNDSEDDKGKAREPRNELKLDRLDTDEDAAPKESAVERARNRRKRGGEKGDEAEKGLTF